MLLAQISDLHVAEPGSPADAQYHSTARLERVVQHLCSLDPVPDAVVCTGDLVNAGTPAEYDRLLSVLRRLPMPCYVIPGNHDDRENLRAAFADRGYLPAAGVLCYAAELGPVRLLALDTQVPGAPSGQLDRARLAWLEARLAEAPGRPTVVIMHHPPFATGIEGMDAMGLDGGDALAALVRRHPQVERILCGHVHRPIVKRFAGTVATVCPSTAVQVQLELRHSGEVRLVDEPVACQLHLWTEALGLVSHTSYVPMGA